MPEQAIPYWMKAGERALARSAYREPLAYFDRALTLARSLPESPARTRQILDLLFLLGKTHSRNYNVSEALQTFKEAFELARAVDSPADLARAAVGATLAESFTGAQALEFASADGGSPRCAGRGRNRRAQPVTQSVQLPIMDVGQLRAGGCAEPSGSRSSAAAWRPQRALSRTVFSGAELHPGPTLPRRAVPKAPAVDCRAA
jgi:tetratricopeptide (TPR) repeat protein